MSLTNVISLLGGVALFLFGMSLMGDGLKRVAGSKMELILYRLAGTPLKGVLLGAAVTAVIQSSSATSVMVVGFVNSGMMKLGQAISVIHGALIGTSVTGWIIALSSIQGTGGWVSLLSTSTLSALVAVIGIFLRMFSKKQSHHHVGDILLGFAVLMFGMQSMSGAVEPLRESEGFLSLLTTFSNPILGVLVGAAFTAVLQSASAAVGILQAIALTGAVTFATAYPIILGIAIGSAVPVLFSALGAKVDGRRAAMSYLLIEVLGALIFGVLYYALDALIGLGLNHWRMDAFNVALVNTLFRAATACVLAPFPGCMKKLTALFVKEREDEKELKKIISWFENAEIVKPQDLRGWFRGVLSNAKGEQLAWDWIRDEWAWMEKTVGGDMEFATFITVISKVFKTQKRYDEFDSFFTDKESDMLLNREIKMDRKVIASRVDLIASEKDAVNAAVKAAL